MDDAELSHRLAIELLVLEHSKQSVLHRFETTTKLALYIFNSLVLVNGGGLTVLLTKLTGDNAVMPPYTDSIRFLVFGLVLAICSAIIGFLASNALWYYEMRGFIELSKKSVGMDHKFPSVAWPNAVWGLAVLTAAGSLGCFCVGVMAAVSIVK